ncbi:MAG: hypothetical protein MI802_12170 [Desulfobacterales bacterium]|nr:hypothetical protein [Desulfobacterales bacterium]
MTNPNHRNVLMKQFQLLVENTYSYFWIVDTATLRLDFLTRTLNGTAGTDPENYKGLHIGERLTRDSMLSAMKLLNDEILDLREGTSDPHTLELQIVRKNGSLCGIDIRAMLFRDTSDLVKIIGMHRDITDNKPPINGRQKSDEVSVDGYMKHRASAPLIPICSGCRRIRHGESEWWPLEAYITKRTGQNLTHTICPDCEQIYTPGLT